MHGQKRVMQHWGRKYNFFRLPFLLFLFPYMCVCVRLLFFLASLLASVFLSASPCTPTIFLYILAAAMGPHTHTHRHTHVLCTKTITPNYTCSCNNNNNQSGRLLMITIKRWKYRWGRKSGGESGGWKSKGRRLAKYLHFYSYFYSAKSALFPLATLCVFVFPLFEI